MNVVVIGCRHNTIEFINQLVEDDIRVDAAITIDETVSKKVDVAGFVDLEAFIPSGIPVYRAASYGLATDEDRDLLRGGTFRLGFCIGWQRLLPPWFLEKAEIGIFGMHASRHNLPGGRGRSPINWSLIEGCETLHATVFQYAEEADAGPPLDVQDIEVTVFDTVHTLQQKCRIAFNNIVRKHWKSLNEGSVSRRTLTAGQASWYPKRTPKDGRIDWNESARTIYDFIRAQTRPYPGAYAVCRGEERRIWRAFPFGAAPNYSGIAPGTVLETFHDGAVLIQCQDMPLHVVEHDFDAVRKGDLLV